MAVQKNKLNRFFAGLIIILLLGMIGVSIYFQVIIEGLNSENEFLADSLKETTLELYGTLDKLTEMNNTAQNLNTNLVSYTDEFQEVYEICEGTNSDLSNELIKTKSELSKSELKVASMESHLNNVQTSLFSIKAEFININNMFDDLNGEISSIPK